MPEVIRAHKVRDVLKRSHKVRQEVTTLPQDQTITDKVTQFLIFQTAFRGIVMLGVKTSVLQF